MSNEILEERVGAVERDVSSLKSEQVLQGARLGRVETDVGKTLTGVEKLLEREARRPEPVSLRHIAATLAATAATVAALACFVWWFVGVSPPVAALSDRLDKIDRRMEHAEWKYGWAARVDK